MNYIAITCRENMILALLVMEKGRMPFNDIYIHFVDFTAV